MKNSSDVVIHINEKLDKQRRTRFSDTVQQITGVVSATLQEARPHLMIVAYDSSQTKAQAILSDVRKTGMQAQLVGWL